MLLGFASEKAKCSTRRALLWELTAKNRKRKLALRTSLRTVYQRRQLLLQVACLIVLLLANNNGAAVLMLGFDSSPILVPSATHLKEVVRNISARVKKNRLKGTCKSERSVHTRL